MDNNEQRIKPRARLIIIKNGRILMSYVRDKDFYFFIGGKMEFGETLIDTCKREVKEECGANFIFNKILYVSDYIKPEENEHSLQIFILGDIDKFEEVEGFPDEETNGNHYQTWLEMSKLENYDIRPKGLVKKLLEDYKNNFTKCINYIGEMN
jgi:ADP-ribose pyrophosphatase YjhB (NUDIX family)